jgi:5'-3' exonuclease
MPDTESLAQAPVVLIDLSSIAYPIYMMSQGNPNANHTAETVVGRVHALAQGCDKVAICCDSGKSFRKDLDPTYKANRPEKDEVLIHQIRTAIDMLRGDGFPVWAESGFEADDLIASATHLLAPTIPVLIVTADKDLLQLVSGDVHVKAAKDGSVLDEDAVKAKFGVRPDQMRDYLCLVGDTADNVKGADKIGPKKAAELLIKFGTLDALYEKMGTLSAGVLGLSASLVTSLLDFRERLPLVRQLISLRTDAPVPVAQLDIPRTPPSMEEPEPMTEEPTVTAPAAGVVEVEIRPVTPTTEPAPEPLKPLPTTNGHTSTAIAVVDAVPVEFEKQLEPRSMQDAITVAKYVHDSRLFMTSYGTPQAVLSTILAGREMGIQAMASLRAIHIIDGKPSLSADLIRALVIRSGLAKHFRCTERTATRATFETQRGDDPPISLTFTIEEGRAAWPKDEAAWLKSGWGKNPADMLVARAGAKLARLVYPDVVHGIYAPEEIEAA